MPEAVSQFGVGPRRNGNRSLKSGGPGSSSRSLRFSVFHSPRSEGLHAVFRSTRPFVNICAISVSVNRPSSRTSILIPRNTDSLRLGHEPSLVIILRLVFHRRFEDLGFARFIEPEHNSARCTRGMAGAVDRVIDC